MWGGIMFRAVNIRKSNARTVLITPNQYPMAESCFYILISLVRVFGGPARVRQYATLGQSGSQA